MINEFIPSMGNCVNNILNYYMKMIDNMVFYSIHIIIFVPKVVYCHDDDI
jgi:hypothetical protein